MNFYWNFKKTDMQQPRIETSFSVRKVDGTNHKTCCTQVPEHIGLQNKCMIRILLDHFVSFTVFVTEYNSSSDSMQRQYIEVTNIVLQYIRRFDGVQGSCL